jgi:phosphoribosylanthranilate isomerase
LQNYAGGQKIYQLENFISWKNFYSGWRHGGMITVKPTDSGKGPAMAARTRLKICCIASPGEAKLAAGAGADLLGLVGPMTTGPGPIEEEMIGVYGPTVTAFLLDSGRPSARELGGTGRVHDWEVSAEFVARSARPVFLAGGLTPENVGEAIRRVRPSGVDLCNGVRVNGALDPGLLRAFMEAVQAADRGIGS